MEESMLTIGKMFTCAHCGGISKWYEDTCAIRAEDREPICPDCLDKHYGYWDGCGDGAFPYKTAMTDDGVLCPKCKGKQ
jgi:hypothetical protein